MDINEIKKNAFAMPIYSPTYPKGPYRFINREYLIITYRTCPKALEKVLPKPLMFDEPIVKYEFIRMPDSSGFGDYTESGQVIPVLFKGQKGNFVHSMFLDAEPPIAAGREIWGFPKTYAHPTLKVDHDVLCGKLHYYDCLVAQGTMTFKSEKIDPSIIQTEMEQTPNFLLKIIPHVDGSLQICQLVSHRLENVTIKEAYTGKGALELFSHAMAPVNDLPVLEVLSSHHFVSDLTLPFGKVVYDYINN